MRAAWQTLLEPGVPSRVGPWISPAFFAFLPRGQHETGANRSLSGPCSSYQNTEMLSELAINSKRPGRAQSQPSKTSGSGGAADTQALLVANQTA